MSGPDPVFVDRLEEGEAHALERRGIVRTFPRGAALFHERQSFDRVLVLRSGRVKLCAITADGREVMLGVRGPGELLGELSAMDGEPRQASAIAIEPLEALVIGCGDFTAYLEEHPRVALVIAEMLARRLRDADRKRVEFAAQDSVGRVSARLVELAERFGEPGSNGGVRIALPLSQDELAGWIGASREAVSKALQSLRALGWVETHRRGFTVHELEALRRRAS